jgi:hypothetical protein
VFKVEEAFALLFVSPFTMSLVVLSSTGSPSALADRFRFDREPVVTLVDLVVSTFLDLDITLDDECAS